MNKAMHFFNAKNNLLSRKLFNILIIGVSDRNMNYLSREKSKCFQKTKEF